MADLTHIFHVGQKVRVFVADDIWQKWHKGTVKETHEDYILVDVPDICDHMSMKMIILVMFVLNTISI